MTTLELVRHAKAHSRDRWWGKPDRERPLTETGIAQSKALARELLAAGPVDAVWSSPFVRCVQTVQPLAVKTDLPVGTDEALAEATTLPVVDGGDAWVSAAWLGGRAIAFVNRLCDAHPDGRVVACSHGDVVPALMAVLVGRDGLDLSDVRLKKGARYTLEFDGRRCVRATASAAPSS